MATVMSNDTRDGVQPRRNGRGAGPGVILMMVAENMQATLRIQEHARNLRLATFNVGVKTLRIGEQARTLVPIAAQIHTTTTELAQRVAEYRASCEVFVQAIAVLVKNWRMRQLFDVARSQSIHAADSASAIVAGIQRTSRVFDRDRDVFRLWAMLNMATDNLRDAARLGRYVSSYTRLESVETGGGEGALVDATASMASVWGSLSDDVDGMTDRLVQIRTRLFDLTGIAS